MFKVTLSGDGDLVLLREILDGLDITEDQFQKMCIASGCDYLKSVRGVGPQTSLHLVRTGENVIEQLSIKGATNTYKEQFVKVQAVFKHQTVFDLETCTTIPLQPLQTAQLPDDVQNLCGKYPCNDKYSNAPLVM